METEVGGLGQSGSLSSVREVPGRTCPVRRGQPPSREGSTEVLCASSGALCEQQGIHFTLNSVPIPHVWQIGAGCSDGGWWGRGVQRLPEQS